MSFTESTPDRFRILKPLAAGGYANVYLAQQLDLDRQVAVKVLRTEDVDGESQRERFMAEARITAFLSHPNIVQVLDFGLAGAHPWIAYEYLPGRTLEQILRDGPMPWREAVDAAVQVARGLSEAHGKGIIHRDIKPENVMRVESGGYKIADFGIAKWQGGNGVKTSVGLILGTPDYMSPEHIRGADPTPQFDIYALGAMLYELLVGRAPFHEKNVSRVLQGHLKVEPKPVRVSCPEAPRDLEEVVKKCLAKEPGERYASAQELEQALLAVAPASAGGAGSKKTVVSRSLPVRSRGVRMSGRVTDAVPVAPSRRGPAAALALVAALGLAAGGMSLRRGSAVLPVAPPSEAPSASAAAPVDLPPAELARLFEELAIPAGNIRAKQLGWVEKFTAVDGMLATEMDADSDHMRSELSDLAALVKIEQALAGLEERIQAGETAGPGLEILRVRLTGTVFMVTRNIKIMRDAVLMVQKDEARERFDALLREVLRVKDVSSEIEFRCLRIFAQFLEAYPRALEHAASRADQCAHLPHLLEDLLHVTRNFSRATWSEMIKNNGYKRLEELQLALRARSDRSRPVALAMQLADDLVAHAHLSGTLALDRELYGKTRAHAEALQETVGCAREGLQKVYQIILKDPAAR